MQKRIFTAIIGIALLCATAYAQPISPIEQNTLLNYLDQLTQWQRDAVALEPSATNSREIVFRDSLRDNAGKTINSGFTFLRSIADAEAKFVTVDPESMRSKLMQRMVEIRQGMQHMSGDERRVEQARLDLLQTILDNLNSASSKSPNKLSYTIESLARSIPELNSDKVRKSDDAPATVKHSSTSILTVSADIFALTRKQRELNGVTAATTQLKDQSMALMKILRAGLGEPEVAQEGEEKSDDEEDKPAAPALTPDQRIDAYKRLGAYIVPLAESMRWMDASRQTLKEWSGVLDAHREQLLRQLSIYIGVLLLTIIIAVIISELARRAIKRVPDGKRKRQLNFVRRVLTYVAVVFIILFNFLSDFGSFATFAGFLTAGLAVALQGVLLSLVAHFLFYGRYGVRNGDRVQVSDVTGDIIQIGMVRFYVRELRENEAGSFEPTGRVVAFPNAILFQNIAFYKYSA